MVRVLFSPTDTDGARPPPLPPSSRLLPRCRPALRATATAGADQDGNAMRLITLHFTGPTTHKPDRDAVTELLRAQAVPTDRIEHLWVRAEPGRVDLAAFLLLEDEATALLAARAFCTRALANIASLADWRLAD